MGKIKQTNMKTTIATIATLAVSTTAVNVKFFDKIGGAFEDLGGELENAANATGNWLEGAGETFVDYASVFGDEEAWKELGNAFADEENWKAFGDEEAWKALGDEETWFPSEDYEIDD